MLERDLRVLEQRREGLVGLAEALAPAQLLDAARRMAGFAAQQAEDAQERRQACRLAADRGVAHEIGALARALAAVPAHVAAPGVGDIGAVKLADPVVGQAGPATDGAGTRFVADQAQRQVQPQPVAGISIVGNSHVYRLDSGLSYW